LHTSECGTYSQVKEDARFDSMGLSHVKINGVLSSTMNLSGITNIC
jgi:hypothetical protein